MYSSAYVFSQQLSRVILSRVILSRVILSRVILFRVILSRVRTWIENVSGLHMVSAYGRDVLKSI